MKLFIVLSLCALASANPSGEWKQLKSPMEHPRYQKLLTQLYRKANLEHAALNGGRIVGGERAVEGQFPYHIYAYIDDSWLCGGSIINQNYILTAAHCLINVGFIDVFIGSIHRMYEAPYHHYLTAANWIMHPNYNDATLNNDIGLLRTPSINFGGFIGPVTLPRRVDDTVNLDGYSGTTTGFGRYTDEEPDFSVYLLHVSALLMSNTRCAQTFGAYITDNHVCKDGYQGRGICTGDSGGPMNAVVHGQSVQVGIASFGAAAGCEQGYPSVYTRVSKYLDWISQHSGVVILP